MIKKIKNKLFNDIHLKELLKGSSVTLVFRILGLFLGYIFTLMITRWYGAHTMGLYTLSITVLNIFVIIGVFGFDYSLVKFVADFNVNNKFDLIKKIYYQSLTISIPLGLLLSLILFFNASFFAKTIFKNEELIIFFQIVSLGILPLILLKINSAMFRGLKKIKVFSFFELVFIFLLSVIFLSIFYYFNFKNEVVIFTQIIAIYVAMIISYVFLKKLFVKEKIYNRLDYKKLLNTSYPMLLTSSFGLLMSWTDVIMLGIMKSEVEVGIYSVVLKLATLTNITLIAINSIAAPKFSELYSQNDMKNLKKLVQNSTKIMFYSTLPIILILIIFPNLILSMFGEEFVVATTALWILIFGQFINVISGSVGNLLKMTGNEKIFQYIIFVSLVINIILNYYLISEMGINGAAIATSISLVFWNVLSIIYVKIKLDILTLYIPKFLLRKN